MGMLDEQLAETSAFVIGDDFTLANEAPEVLLRRLSTRPVFAEYVGNGMP